MSNVKGKPVPLSRRLLAETVGTALLVTVVVGSGIAAQHLSPTDVGLQLLENSTATVFGLAVLILIFGPVSGAHFNPVVSGVDWLLGRRSGTGISGRHVAAYTLVQIIGAILGAILANVMFDLPAVSISTHDRATTGHGVGEIVATAGLDHVDLRAGQKRPRRAVRGGGRRVHRRGLLVHQFHQLRQPGRDDRPDVLRHLRRDRAGLGAAVHRGADHRGRCSVWVWCWCCFPTPVTPPIWPSSHTPAQQRRTRPPRRPESCAAQHLDLRRRPFMTATVDKPSVLFVCVHNAGRSQMAAGYLTALGRRCRSRSAPPGRYPATAVNPVAVAAMAEEGIDISTQTPKVLTTEAVQASDVVITMGCGDACPVFPGKRYEDWELEDPAGQGIDVVRRVRDDIRGRIQELLAQLLPAEA